MLDRLWAALSGLDGPGKRALPIGEFLHPLSLGCVVVLVANDHLLKGSGIVPSIVTGKLSDFAGLAFFPLLLTSSANTVLCGVSRLGARIDFSLRRWKLYSAIAATALAFALLKLVPSLSVTVAGWLSVGGWKADIVADPSDLLALSALVLPLWIGNAELARFPLGRLEVIERSMAHSRAAIEGAIADVGGGQAVSELAGTIGQYLANGPAGPLSRALEQRRFGTSKHPADGSTRIG